MKFDLTLLGDKELDRVLRTFPEKVQTRALRPAVRDGIKIVAKAAKAAMPRASGAMMRAGFKVRSMKRKKGRVGVRIYTGTREQLGIPEKAKGYYPFAVETGTAARHATPFLRPAAGAQRGPVFQAVWRRLWLELERLRDAPLAEVADVEETV